MNISEIETIEDKKIKDKCITYKTLSNIHLVSCELEDVTIDTSFITGINAQSTIIDNLAISDTHFDLCTLTLHAKGIKMAESSMNNSRIVGGTIEASSFYKSTIFSRCVFNSVIFKNCNFSDTRFQDCIFRDVKFTDCSFTGSFCSLRTHLTTQVVFLRSSFFSSLFTKCRFFERTMFEDESDSPKDKYSVIMRKCTLGGTIFNTCSLDGIDILTLRECIIENAIDKAKSVPKTSSMRATQKLPIIQPKEIEPVTAPAYVSPYAVDDLDDSDWYYRWGYNSRKRGTHTAVVKPEEPKCLYAYRFFSTGLKNGPAARRNNYN